MAYPRHEQALLDLTTSGDMCQEKLYSSYAENARRGQNPRFWRKNGASDFGTRLASVLRVGDATVYRRMTRSNGASSRFAVKATVGAQTRAATKLTDERPGTEHVHDETTEPTVPAAKTEPHDSAIPACRAGLFYKDLERIGPSKPRLSALSTAQHGGCRV